MTDRPDFRDAPTNPGNGQSDRHGEIGDEQPFEDRRVSERRVADRVLQRLAELETWRKAEIDPWRFRLTGYNDGNGRIGDIEERIPKTADERRAERSTHRALRWMGVKVAGGVVAVAAMIAGAGWKLRPKYDAAIEARAAGAADRAREAAWRDALERDVGRLFSLFNLKRTSDAPVDEPKDAP